MPAIQEIPEQLIRSNISRAVCDVFKTMLNRDAENGIVMHEGVAASWPPLPPDGEAIPQVVGTVGFIGDANGLIYLYLPLALAQVLTCHLLGMTQVELEEAGDEVINDAIGELTNMTVGSFKSSLCDAGFPCKLTIPSILRGSNFCIEPISSVQRYIYSFESSGYKIVADILMKTGD